MHPLVSTIVPAYNASLFIEDALSSIFYQDYPNMEIIVVNDGSADNTLEIIKKCADKGLIILNIKDTKTFLESSEKLMSLRKEKRKEYLKMRKEKAKKPEKKTSSKDKKKKPEKKTGPEKEEKEKPSKEQKKIDIQSKKRSLKERT